MVYSNKQRDNVVSLVAPSASHHNKIKRNFWMLWWFGSKVSFLQRADKTISFSWHPSSKLSFWEQICHWKIWSVTNCRTTLPKEQNTRQCWQCEVHIHTKGTYSYQGYIFIPRVHIQTRGVSNYKASCICVSVCVCVTGIFCWWLVRLKVVHPRFGRF